MKDTTKDVALILLLAWLLWRSRSGGSNTVLFDVNGNPITGMTDGAIANDPNTGKCYQWNASANSWYPC